MAKRLLDVFIDGDLVGKLREDSGIWAFQYDARWLEKPNAYALSPGLAMSADPIQDGGTMRPVQWYFDNLLAEGATRELLAAEARISGADSFGLLERFGSESAGALTLLPPGSTLPAGGKKPLSDDELFRRIRDLPRISLAQAAPKRMSLAGAQHKLPVIFEGNHLFEPIGSETSTFILKPNHRAKDQYPHSAANEWFAMRLANELGLEVPYVEHRYCPAEDSDAGHEPYFLVRRFDRRTEGKAVRRIQSIDACQLLNVDATFKYNEMSASTLMKVAEATRSKAATRVRLFRWCLYNAIIGNRDAHLKNLSFLVSDRGIELAPHYDLASTAMFDAQAQWRDAEMSIQFGDARTYSALSREGAIALGRELLIAPKAALGTLVQMTKAIPDVADKVISEFEQRPFPHSASAIRGGELYVLRQIRHVAIPEILHRFVGTQ